MSSLTARAGFADLPACEEHTRPAPAPPTPGPVLIHDAVIPFGGTTLLATLLHRWSLPDDD